MGAYALEVHARAESTEETLRLNVAPLLTNSSLEIDARVECQSDIHSAVLPQSFPHDESAN